MIVPADRATGKKVQLMATCLCDAFFDDVAKATVQVLEYLGCEVEFPEGQTCCGQPAFNAGDWSAARRMVRHAARQFTGSGPVVLPSGSCAAMLFHGASLAFEHEPDFATVSDLAGRTWEVLDFIVSGLGVKTWEGTCAKKIAFHSSCHLRGTGTPAAARQLLGSLRGLELVGHAEPEQCCGFGGTFSVAFPHVSANMGLLKLQNIRAAEPDLLVAADMSCLMHLRGLAEKQGHPLPVRHAIQVLRDALVAERKIHHE
ncbi:MAG: (Fe-S)-binding protein [Verrucomicrobiales bacterium]|jgi:L-lactate dehydrogenase complex protein LldE|nr:(Fe-S)-binding protein [Verrucomicrobiales bacterium]